MVKTLVTDAYGKVTYLVNNRSTYEPLTTRTWAWRVKGVGARGGVRGRLVTTTVRTVLRRSASAIGTYTGKVRLIKGRRYQFWSLNGSASHTTVFALTSASGHRVLYVGAHQFKKVAFTAPATGYYSWRMRFGVGFFASWGIW